MKSKIEIFLIIFTIYISSVFLAVILTPGIGLLYSNIFDVQCGNSIFIIAGLNRGCKIEGFIYSYSFLLPLFSFLFLRGKIAWLTYLFGILILLTFSVLIEDYLSFLIYFILFIPGYLLALGTNKIRKRID